jgi:hypothetical protein
MPSLELPPGHKVLDSGKEPNKGLYRMIQRPNGTIYKEWYHLYSPAELQKKTDLANKNEGQFSRDNLIGNTQAAMGLTAANGAVAAGAYYNMGANRQQKLKRLIRGATLGKTRPQGVGVKTQAGSAGDVRGRVAADRPPAIVRTAESFKGRGPVMPQQGNLFDQPEPSVKKAGTRYAPAGTAKATGKGTRGVPRPAPRSSGKAGASAAKTPVTQARPIPQRPTPLKTLNNSPLAPPYHPRFSPKSEYYTNPIRQFRIPFRPQTYVPLDSATPGLSLPPLSGERTALRPTPLNPDAPNRAPGIAVNRSPKSAEDLKAIADAKAGRGGKTMPERAPGIAINRNPKSAEDLKAIADAKAGRAAGSAPATQTRRTTPLQRGGAAPRVPNPVLPARNTSPITGKYNGRSTGVSVKPKSPADLKAIEDALRARRAGGTIPPVTNKPNTMPPQFNQMPKPGGGPSSQVISRVTTNMPKPAPVPPKPGFFGKVGGMLKGSGPMMAVGHLLEDAGAGIASASKGDWKSAGQRANDLLGHTPFGHRGLIDDAIDVLTGKKITRGVPTSIGDRIVHAKYFPNRYYSDSNEAIAEARGKQPAPAPTPAASGGNKPAGGTSQKPSGSAYFPEASRNGSAVRTPDSYLGEAFDYSLQKGTKSGQNYLEHMFRRDKISDDDQQRLRERFNKKVVGDQTLKNYGADQGITKTAEANTPGLGNALLEKYRDTGSYKGNTDYGKMREAAVARLEASKK